MKLAEELTKVAGLYDDAVRGAGSIGSAIFRGGDAAKRDAGIMSAANAKGQGHPEWAGSEALEMADPSGIKPIFPAGSKPPAKAK